MPRITAERVAELLYQVGIDEADLADYQANAIEVVPAAAHYLQGIPDAKGLAILADVVVLGTARKFDTNAMQNDSYLSSVVFEVDRVLKGPVDLSQLTIRQESGLQADGTMIKFTSDFTPRMGVQYLLFASHESWAKQAGDTVAKQSPDTAILLSGPWEVDGTIVKPLAPSRVPPTPLTEVLSTIEQVVIR